MGNTLSIDKQIEEMVKNIDTVMQSRCFHKSCNECEFDRYAICKATMLADALVNDYGYRKASEVAKEIFEEIDRLCIDTFGNFNHRAFAELKKKYESEKDDG